MGSSDTNMKILMMGNQRPSILAAEEMLATGEHELFVVSPPDTVIPPWHQSLHQWAQDHEIPNAQPEDVNSDSFFRVASAFDPDLVLSVFYNQVLQARMLNLPRVGALNVHPSLLPAYRGSGVLIWALMDGVKEVGITIHHMVERVDAGEIVLRRAIGVAPDDTGIKLYERVADLVQEVFRDEFLAMISAGEFPGKPMDGITEPYTRHTPRRNNVDWTQNARSIVDVVRALTWPLDGAYTTYLGERLWIWKVDISQDKRDKESPVGVISQVDERLVVRAGDGMLIELLEIGYGGQTLTGEEFLRRHWHGQSVKGESDEVIVRSWATGDDPSCVSMLEPLGWTTAERYTSKFDDEGVTDGSITVAERKGVVCGHSMLALRRFLTGDARIRTGTIGQVVVPEEHRGQGIGRRLLDEALRFANERRLAMVSLTAHPDRGVANEMYRRRGFERVQDRLVAEWKPRRPNSELSAVMLTKTNTAELMRLRRVYAFTTGAVQDRDYDQSIDWPWYLVKRQGRPCAAVRIRLDGELPSVSSVLFDTQEDPSEFVAAAAAAAGFPDIEIHASPSSPLVQWMPDLMWRSRGGENLVYVPSLRRLMRALLPTYRVRAAAMGLNSPKVTLIRGNAQVGVEVYGDDARLMPPLLENTTIEFSNEGLAALVLGAIQVTQALDRGIIKTSEGRLPIEDALLWLFPYQYCDFTQHSAW